MYKLQEVDVTKQRDNSYYQSEEMPLHLSRLATTLEDNDLIQHSDGSIMEEVDVEDIQAINRCLVEGDLMDDDDDEEEEEEEAIMNRIFW